MEARILLLQWLWTICSDKLGRLRLGECIHNTVAILGYHWETAKKKMVCACLTFWVQASESDLSLMMITCLEILECYWPSLRLWVKGAINSNLGYSIQNCMTVLGTKSAFIVTVSHSSTWKGRVKRKDNTHASQSCFLISKWDTNNWSALNHIYWVWSRCERGGGET